MGDTLKEMVENVRNFVGDSGTCSEERAVKAINDARRLLWNKRDWNVNSEYLCISCADGGFTLPNRYEQQKLAWIDGVPATLADEWFNATPIARSYTKDRSCHRAIVEVGGWHCLFQDYTVSPYFLSIVIEDYRDIGTKISFDVIDEYQSNRHITIVAGAPPTQVSNDIRIVGVRSASKPRTAGRVRVYAQNPNINQRLLLAIYHPDDVNPAYRRFRLPKDSKNIVIYAPRKYYDLVEDSQLVEFSADAMIFAVTALNSRENRKIQEFLSNLSLAAQEEEKVMEGDEIPTAAPIRVANYSRAENLIGSDLLSPSPNDYFLYR